MGQQNRISIEPSMAVVKEAIGDVTKAYTILKPYLQALAKDERQSLPKMSDKTVSFVEKTDNYTQSHGEFSPAFLDVPEMAKDLGAVKVLKPLLDVLASFHSDVDDTVLLCGSEAFAASRIYYNSVVYAAKQGVQAAKPIAEDLAKRFPGRARKTKDKTADAAPQAGDNPSA
jgi:hypothetical protein